MSAVQKLINDYEVTCNNLVAHFAKRYDVQATSEDWVGGCVGGVLGINDEFFIDMEDVILMLRKGISWEEFLRFWDYNMDAHYLGLNSINLRSWINGAPRLTHEQIEGLKTRRKELTDLVEKYKKEF